jgi:hypothetical protein
MSLGFNPSKVDASLFFYSDSSCTMFVIVYVDDIIVASSSLKFTNVMVQKLNQEFALKDLGDLHYFLGIQVKRTQDGVLMTQERYSPNILKRVNMDSCCPVGTPIVPCEKLLITDGQPLGARDATLYRSVVAALQYLTLTRPDLSFVLSHVYQFLHCPTTVHWERVKRVLWYIKGTSQHGIKFVKSLSHLHSGFSDANWAGCPNDRRSIGGVCNISWS